MDVWCVHARSNHLFLLNKSFCNNPIGWNSRCNSIAFGIRVPRKESLSDYCMYRSLVSVRAMGKKNSPGNSSTPNSENSDHLKAGRDGLKGNNTPSGNNESADTGSQKSKHKPLDWREFRALLYIQEQAENVDSVHNQGITSPQPKSLPAKWAHPISAPENGCLLVATEKLDGVRTFERTVILLIRSGTRNPQEWPFGVVINRPLHRKMKHMNPTNSKLATTFADCPLHFGGPLDASMFLLRGGETTALPGFEDVVPGVYFGSRNSLDKASGLVKKGTFRPQDFTFFMGYAGWQVDQLREEIDSEYWYAAACSPNLIMGSQISSSESLWEEVLQLMGGRYSELSRKPKRDI